MERIKGVIFDFDGLMVKSEVYWVKAFAKACKKFGVTVRKEIFYNGSGLPEEELRSKILEEYPNIDVVKFREYSKNYVYKKTKSMQKLSIKRGLKQLIKYLVENNIKFAIASGNSPEIIIKNLSRAKIDTSLFTSIIGFGSEEFKSKPDPEIFLISCKKLGLEPEKCLVLEDSYNGVRAGRSAGCKVIMVEDSMPPNAEMFDKADRVVKNLNKVRKILKNNKNML